jgi:cytochrome c-type biogenesis protein CcmE
VEGRLGQDGVFHAQTLLAKCPSRFSSKPYVQ